MKKFIFLILVASTSLAADLATAPKPPSRKPVPPAPPLPQHKPAYILPPENSLRADRRALEGLLKSAMKSRAFQHENSRKLIQAAVIDLEKQERELNDEGYTEDLAKFAAGGKPGAALLVEAKKRINKDPKRFIATLERLGAVVEKSSEGDTVAIDPSHPDDEMIAKILTQVPKVEGPKLPGRKPKPPVQPRAQIKPKVKPAQVKMTGESTSSRDSESKDLCESLLKAGSSESVIYAMSRYCPNFVNRGAMVGTGGVVSGVSAAAVNEETRERLGAPIQLVPEPGRGSGSQSNGFRAD